MELGSEERIFVVHCRKSLHYREQTIKSNSGEGSEENRGKKKKKACLPKENLSSHEQNVHGNMKSRGHSDVLLEMRNMLLETEGKAIHGIK